MLPLVMIVVVVPLSQAFLDLQRDTEIIPRIQQYIIVGQPVTLNCTLSAGYTGPLNASYLYFTKTKGNKEEVSEQTLLIDEHILQLHIPNVSLGGNQYQCSLNKTLNPGFGLPASRFVYGGNLPRSVSNLTCVSDNNFDMTCQWPCHQEDQFQTWHHLTYTVDSVVPVSDYKDCPSFTDDTIKTCRCYWHLLKAGLGYHMRIVSTNKWGDQEGVTGESTFSINSGSIVKPSPVSQLTAQVSSSSSLTVSWSSPEGLAVNGEFGYTLHYQLVYNSRWMTQPRVIAMTNGTTSTLVDLTPATLYTLSVQCWPINGGYSSDLATIEATTREDVPSSGPEWPLGAYNIQPCPGTNTEASCREVYLFWLELPEQNKNGQIEYYRLSYSENSDTKLQQKETNSFSEVLSLHVGTTYKVEIRAVNAQGSSPPSVLILTPSDTAIYKPRVVAESADPQYSWLKLEILPYDEGKGLPDNYTLVWCRGSRERRLCRPTDSPQYRVLPGNTSSELIKTDSSDVVYSLSANWPAPTGSSGLLDWICVYDYDGVPGKPVITITEQRDERCLHFEWQPLKCNTENRGRVHYFQVYYNPAYNPENVTTVMVNASIHRWQGCNLQPATDYDLAVEGVSKTGKQGIGTVVTMTTPESPPDSPPYNVSVVSVGVGQATVTWMPPVIPNGRITSYLIVASSGERNDRVALSVGGTSPNTTIAGLNGHVHYTLTMQAVNSAGISPLSDPVSFITPVTAPSKVTLDSFVKINGSLANISWSVPKPSNGPIKLYLIQVRAEDSDAKMMWWRNQTVDGQHTMTNLSVECAKSAYAVFVNVAAVTSDNITEYIGPPSEERDKEMCSNSETKEIVPWVVIGVIVFLIIVVIIGLIWYCKRKAKKQMKMKVTIPAPITELPEIGTSYHLVKQDDLLERTIQNTLGSDDDSARVTMSDSTQSSSLDGDSSAGMSPSTIEEETAVDDEDSNQGTLYLEGAVVPMDEATLDTSGESLPQDDGQDADSEQTQSTDTNTNRIESYSRAGMASYSGGYQGCQTTVCGPEGVSGPAVPMFAEGEGDDLSFYLGSQSSIAPEQLEDTVGSVPDNADVITNYSAAARKDSLDT